MSRKFVSTICIIVLCLAYNFALADSHRMETTPTDWWWYHSQSDADIVNVIGFNFRLPEMEAAITRCQLKKLKELVKIRQDNFRSVFINVYRCRRLDDFTLNFQADITT